MKRIIIIIMLYISGSGQAGGWIHPSDLEDPAQQTVIEIVAEQTAETTKITYRLGFVGDAIDFVWIMPLYSDLLDIEPSTLDWNWRRAHWLPGSYREGAYNRRIITADNACNNIIRADNPYNQGSGGPPSSDARVSDNQLILSAVAAASWMIDNGYPVDDDLSAVLSDYQEQGIPVLVLPMSTGSSSYAGDLPVLTFTFANDNNRLHIPTRLISQSTQPDVEIRLWVFGDARYTPVTYADAPIDFTQLRSPNRTVSPIRENQGPYYQHTNYTNLREETLLTAGSSAVITEYAGNNLEEAGALSQYDHVTRLFAFVGNPEADLILERNESANTVPLFIDASEYVDPLYFYGCTTERAYDEILTEEHRSNLPTGRTRINGLSVAIPPEWVLSEGEIDVLNRSYTIRILAPEPIAVESVIVIDEGFQSNSFTVNNATMPMMVIAPTQVLDFYSPRLNMAMSTTRWFPHGWGNAFSFGITDPTDTADTNQAMYEAMLAYITSLPYYQSDEFLHTLFLNDGFSLPYDETWQAVTTETGIAHLQPLNGDDVSITAQLFEQYIDEALNFIDRRADMLITIQELYGLSDEVIDDILYGLTERTDCASGEETQNLLIPFEDDEQTGYLYFYLSREAYGFIEARTTQDQITNYDEQLRHMLQASQVGQAGACG